MTSIRKSRDVDHMAFCVKEYLAYFYLIETLYWQDLSSSLEQIGAVAVGVKGVDSLVSEQPITPITDNPYASVRKNGEYTTMESLQSALTVVQPSGALNAATAHILQDQLSDHIASSTSAGLMVDMSRVESLDSAGLVSLISALRMARNLSKRFCLCSVPPSIRIVFELTQLDQVFEFVDELTVKAA